MIIVGVKNRLILSFGRQGLILWFNPKPQKLLGQAIVNLLNTGKAAALTVPMVSPTLGKEFE